MAENRAKPLRILHLEDDPSDAVLVQRELDKAGLRFTAERVETREDFARALDDCAPDIILADYHLPGFDGLAALAIAQERCPEAPFVFVTGVLGDERAVETLKRGADDYILKDRMSRLGPAVLRALDDAHVRNEKEALVRKLDELATHDGLTGLYNHRAFYALLEEERLRADRFARPVSLLMIDIDHFKRVNDTHGHLAGDAILKGLSDLLTRQARAIDRVCRYGGEELTLILPETENAAALNIAERLRAAVAAQLFDTGNSCSVHITVSIGVAAYPAHADTPDKLVAAADSALYAAKQVGRNRVCRYEPAMRGASN